MVGYILMVVSNVEGVFDKRLLIFVVKVCNIMIGFGVGKMGIEIVCKMGKDI